MAMIMANSVYGQIEKNIPVDRCAGLPENAFIRDLTKCQSYFRCVGGLLVPGYCVDPWMFNEEIQSCDFKENVDCFSCPTNVMFADLPITTSCTQFVRCINGEPEQLACPNSLYFDPILRECNFANLVPCDIAAAICPIGNGMQPICQRSKKL